MKQYVALLRGINVGGNNKVEMKTLKELFESLGYINVRTYINSGNVIFETSKSEEILTEEIEKALEKKFNFQIRTLVVAGAMIQKINKLIPVTWNNIEQKTDVMFLWNTPTTKKHLSRLPINPDVDNILHTPGAIIWNLRRDNYKLSGMQKILANPLYKLMTVRNVNTVRKLGELLTQEPKRQTLRSEHLK